MDVDRNALPDDIVALKDALLVERARALEVTAELMVVRAKASEDVALIAQQKLRIAVGAYSQDGKEAADGVKAAYQVHQSIEVIQSLTQSKVRRLLEGIGEFVMIMVSLAIICGLFWLANLAIHALKNSVL